MKNIWQRTSTGDCQLHKGGTMQEIRLLKAKEIECRIGSINERGLTLLLYKNARADMKILDETFGIMNWQR